MKDSSQVSGFYPGYLLFGLKHSFWTKRSRIWNRNVRKASSYSLSPMHHLHSYSIWVIVAAEKKQQQNSGCVPGTSERSLPHRWLYSSVWPGIRCNKHTKTAQTHVIWQNEVISYRQTLFRRKTQKSLVSCTLLSYLLNLPARPTEKFGFSLVMSIFS